MATSIRYKEAHVIEAGPILIYPGGRISSFDSTSNVFKPFPKGIFSFGDLLLGQYVFEYNTTIGQ